MSRIVSRIASQISRRDFARGAALTATAVALPAAAMVTQPDPVPLPQTAAAVRPEISAEVEAKYNEVLRRHGARFNAVQKTEVRRQLVPQVQGLEKLRAFALDNADQPATVLHLNVEKI